MDDMTALMTQVAQSMCAGVSCLDRDIAAMRGRTLLDAVKRGKINRPRPYPGNRYIRHQKHKKKGR